MCVRSYDLRTQDQLVWRFRALLHTPGAKWTGRWLGGALSATRLLLQSFNGYAKRTSDVREETDSLEECLREEFSCWRTPLSCQIQPWVHFPSFRCQTNRCWPPLLPGEDCLQFHPIVNSEEGRHLARSDTNALGSFEML